MDFYKRLLNDIIRMFSFFGVFVTIVLIILEGRYLFNGPHGNYLKVFIPLNLLVAGYYFFNKDIKYSK